ncbi:lycopene cyclase family protein [Pseudonocardia sp. H11422]|uniref:lycopene cyclase family protein n=1 Tax=Pseudonocardia sp. H11422 TaxID=2835866 RepID=UPI001BDBC84C|nr:lycopene cyclase family protein [Pseudonocardia sp. H11422]
MPTDDVLVVGGGPAGRAVAVECAARGLRTTLLDPAPDRPWRATYAAWSDELPAAFPAELVAARTPGRAIAQTEHRLGWEYAVLDVAALRRRLDAGLARTGVEVRTGRAAAGPDPHGVRLAGGDVARARVVIDAGGHRQPLRPAGHPARPPAEQTAYGLVVDEDTAGAVVATGEALFMDWRCDHGEQGWPTFLYAVPLGGGAVLLEETSLARRPGLPLPMLRRRLLARLARHGISPGPDAREERVRFPVDGARHRDPAALGFGSAAPLVHPATGFSVATALRLAPRMADALATRLPGSPAAARTAAREVVWPRAARAVHMLRRRGLESLLRMPPAEVPTFFEVFFGLPARHRWAYLTGREDVIGTVAAMNALFGRAGWMLRGRLIGPALLPPAPGADPENTRAG